MYQRLKALPRRTTGSQLRLQRQQRAAVRRAHAQSSRQTTSNSSSPASVPRRRSVSRKAFSVPLKKPKKLESPSAAASSNTERRRRRTMSHTRCLTVARQRNGQIYFRVPSTYKRRTQTVRSSGSSDVPKSVQSTKLEAANGWEQKSPNFSLQECHEAFIKAFAIPTHLYRYLAQRHRQKPLFLDRNLSYLRPAPSAVPQEQSQKPSGIYT